jgi:hypothetical protein
MKVAKCFVVFGVCLFMGACVSEESVLGNGKLDIDIGDYESQLAEWDSQNMLDYQFCMWEEYGNLPSETLITVKNGIPESIVSTFYDNFPKESTIPELYSYIKEMEKCVKDEYNRDNSRGYSFKVGYNTEYHYPNEIITKIDYRTNRSFIITLMPQEEGELEIDIGDYENQVAAWDSQNMLDYQIEVWHVTGNYNSRSWYLSVDYNVTNGNPEKGSTVFRGMETIPEIYSFIKEEEEKIRNAYNGINRSYLSVQYDAEYHYPVKITSGIGHLFGRYWQWEITLSK